MKSGVATTSLAIRYYIHPNWWSIAKKHPLFTIWVAHVLRRILIYQSIEHTVCTDRLPTAPRSRIAACAIRLVDLKVVCMGSHAIVHQLRCGKFRCSHDRQVAIPTKCSCAENERTSGRLAMECSISMHPMLYGIVERKSTVCLRSNDCLIIS